MATRCVFYDREDRFVGTGFLRPRDRVFMFRPRNRGGTMEESLLATDRNVLEFIYFAKGPFGEYFYREVEHEEKSARK